MINCKCCLYGRPIEDNKYQCVNKERQKLWELDNTQFPLVNRESYSCKFSEYDFEYWKIKTIEEDSNG